jgi:hypothetical protein
VAEMCRNQRFINMLERLSVNDEAPQLDSIKSWLLKHIEYSDKPLAEYLLQHGVN